MLHQHITAAVLTTLILSTVLFTIGASSSQSARAQSNNMHRTANLLGNFANFGDQVVKGGGHIADQITKGGAAFLATIAASVPNVRAHFDSTYQDIAKGDQAGAGTQLQQLYANFVNDSETVYGLGQEISQIAQNNSAHFDSHTKQILSGIGVDLKDIALGSSKSNSTSNATGK
jgi:hypothetical protein